MRWFSTTKLNEIEGYESLGYHGHPDNPDSACLVLCFNGVRLDFNTKKTYLWEEKGRVYKCVVKSQFMCKDEKRECTKVTFEIFGKDIHHTLFPWSTGQLK